MNRLLIFQSMMGLTVICGLLMAGWLIKHANEQKGLKALAGFNFFMALWCGGHWLLSVNWPRTGEVLLSLNPLMPTLFLHFAIRYVTDKISHTTRLTELSRYIGVSYGLSILVVIISIGWSGNSVVPWLDFPWFLILGRVGWINLLYTVFVGLLAHGVLLWGYANSHGNTRRTIMFLFFAGGWGFTLATSYISASLGFNHYPYLLWLLPSYLILLTFAVLRYQILQVNYWAIKAIIWGLALLLLLGLTTLLTSMASQLGVAHLSTIPLSIIWLYSIASGLTLWLLYNPLHKLANRLVYPDISLTEQVIDHWLSQLNGCHGYQQLAEVAGTLIGEHIHQPVTVAINHHPVTASLLIECDQHNKQWQFELKNWQDVTPGIRHVADIFAPLLYTSCINLEKSLRLAQQEQQRQEELRLVELGAMAASIAHELRNPLNIISMASAQCEDKVKTHIQSQLKRADTLIQDLLAYSGTIDLKCQTLTLLPLLTALSKTVEKQYPTTITLDCSEILTIDADPFKLQQVVINCLENAASFAATNANGQVLVQCQPTADGVTISFHNNGPPISAALQSQLFKPFISKRVGGSGLGLAIVQRIMTAHHGSVHFDQHLGWNVSFVCCFPHQSSHS